MKIKRKKAKCVTPDVNLTLHQRFSIEDTKERRQIRVMKVKKSYIWREIVRAAAFYF